MKSIKEILNTRKTVEEWNKITIRLFFELGVVLMVVAILLKIILN